MPTLYKPFRGSHGISRGFTGRDHRTQHTGVDYRTPRHTPVLASAAGVVVRSVDLTVSYGRYSVTVGGLPFNNGTGFIVAAELLRPLRTSKCR